MHTTSIRPNSLHTIGLLLLSLLAVPACAQAPAAAIAAAGAAAPLGERSFDEALAGYFSAERPGATVIVTRDGKTLFRKAYGLANVDAKAALRPDTTMRIGSITKQFTAVAILQLVEAGKLKLSDDVRTLLPLLPSKGQTITVEHLLTHTSGLKNFFAMPGFAALAAQQVDTAQVFDFFKDQPLEFEPGQRFAYSNTGYFLLGLIIEKVSGMGYADYLEKNIFAPLQMRHTAYEGRESRALARADGYSPGPDGVRPAPAISIDLAYAAGGLRSTVDDLALWDQAIGGQKLLKPASWARTVQPYRLNDGSYTEYGHGWMLFPLRDVKAQSHDGMVPGFNSFVTRLPEQKVFVAVLGNNAGLHPGAAYLAQKIAAIAIGKPFPEYSAIKLPAAALDQFVGNYRINDKESRLVGRDGEQLYMQRSGRGKMPILPYSANEFFVKDSPNRVHLRFEQAADGTVSQMTLVQDDQVSVSPRVAGKGGAE
ncbi:serine hydrolase [Rugamonas sp. CCM 8940]|uniref:serine hydrolase n=1 Tax=Rugamonas sp. CCM 8940 TaxID=2765359 RepID=UPI0018F64F7C|nr:serine hydrolase [Rugamonas sp. CCM 8940]MBJ7309443.1 serine hydrolase [Rugamonas sp. CCM 8940]